MKDKLKRKLPSYFVGFLGGLSLYLSIRASFNYFFIIVGQFLEGIPSFILFGDSLHPGFFGFSFTLIVLISGWLVSTKYKTFQTPIWRGLWFWNMFIGITFHYLWLITAPVYNTLIPYMSKLISILNVDNIWYSVAVGDTNSLLITLIFTPSIVSCLILIWLAGQYSQYSTEIKEAFQEFEFKNVHLQKWIKKVNNDIWPDIILGPDSDTKELVIQPGRDRTLNNIIVGSIGTGKTSALLLPIINQDLHWMTKFINEYPKISQREDYESEDVRGRYLNSISIIEPSNDLCQKAYKLVKAHGIPDEAVFYIDPTNPNTPSINPMQGPVEKVAEAFAMVIEGLAENGNANDFFKQSEKNHLKNYIYLLKLHEPEQEVTFDMLLRMYDNPQLVRIMHKKLKKTIPKDYESLTIRDERNHWGIVKQIDEWFDMNHLPKTFRNGGQTSTEKVTHGEFRGEEVYYDAQGEYVKGLRNILNDIGANILIRRVLFGKSNFSFDEHLERGGVLLLNTAKGELSGLSNVLGKLVLLSLQNAVFRRTPNTSTFAHIITDEWPDFVYGPFKEFPAQSRKYKAIVTVVAQTVAQLADKYGEMYMQTLLGTLRHKMVFGDIPDYDAELFSKSFGEQEKFKEGKSEQSVSPLQEQPSLRLGSNYQKEKEAILSPTDLIYQKPFQSAVKIVVNNKPMPVRQIDANFVPNAEFKEAVVRVLPESAEIWLKNRGKEGIQPPLVTEGIEEVTAEPPIEIVEGLNPQGEYEQEDMATLPIDYNGAPFDKKIIFQDDGLKEPNDWEYEKKELTEEMEDEEELVAQGVSIETSSPISNKEIPIQSVSDSRVESDSNEIMNYSLDSLLNFKKEVSPDSNKETSAEETSKKPTKSQLGDKELQLMADVLKEIQEDEPTKEKSPFDIISPY